jgi:large subunit ribosomal protein L3
MRTGILGKKVGMTQVFDESGAAIPVTVIEAGPCPIVQIKTRDRDGYNAVQLGFGHRRENSVNRPERGHLKKAGVKPHRFLREFRVDSIEGLSVNSTVDVGAFSAGDFVDVAGTSKGRGFAGAMKRWSFTGAKDSHGAEKNHRSLGSVGSSAWPSRIVKGKRMPGRFGGKRITVLNLQVIKADAERNLLVVKGAVPGPPNGLLMIRKTVRGGQ